MSTILKRRIDRIEAAIMPPAIPRVVIILKPGFDAPAEEHAAYEGKLQQAFANGQRVVVLPMKKTEARDERPGVEYVDSEFEAQLIKADSLPSEQGRSNQLADVLADLSGNVIGVASGVDQPRWR